MTKSTNKARKPRKSRKAVNDAVTAQCAEAAPEAVAEAVAAAPEAPPAAQRVPEQLPLPVIPLRTYNAPDVPHAGGRPTDYQERHCVTARLLSQAGATDEELAEALGIHVRTLYTWYATHEEFRQAVKLGKDTADERVERSFYQRAVGFEHVVSKVMAYEGVPFSVNHREKVLAEPGAAFNWLKNRKPEEWRDRKEFTGAGGEPLIVKMEFVPGAGD